MIKGEQDPNLVRKIRACACDMLDVAEMLKTSGSKDIPPLYETEQAIRRAAVQLFGFFPLPAEDEFKLPSFQLRAPHSSPAEKRISAESLTGIAEYTRGPPL